MYARGKNLLSSCQWHVTRLMVALHLSDDSPSSRSASYTWPCSNQWTMNVSNDEVSSFESLVFKRMEVPLRFKLRCLGARTPSVWRSMNPDLRLKWWLGAFKTHWMDELDTHQNHNKELSWKKIESSDASLKVLMLCWSPRLKPHILNVLFLVL